MVKSFLIMLNSLLQIQLKQYLIGNKIADKITRVSKTSPKNNSETNVEEILRERYISSDRLIT